MELGCHLSRIQSCELKGVGELACYGNVFSVDNFKDTYTRTLLKTLPIQPNVNLKKRLLVFHREVKTLNGATGEHNEGGLGDLSGFLRSGQVHVWVCVKDYIISSETACLVSQHRLLPPCKGAFSLLTDEYLLRLSWMNKLSAQSHFSIFSSSRRNLNGQSMQCNVFFFAALQKLLREVCCTVRVKVCGNKISQTLLKDLFARPWAALVLENQNF